MAKYLVTGAAGFIGSHIVKELCGKRHEVVGLDNLNDYYDVRLKKWRLDDLKKEPDNFRFILADIVDKDALRKIFKAHKFDAVFHLASCVGVRASLENPLLYISTNVIGTLNLLEMCKYYGVGKFIFASTSSVYSGKNVPFSEDLNVNTAISPYATTKLCAEQLAYNYHHLYNLDVSVLRYFTVYGPACRPDMSILRFIKLGMEGNTIYVNGDGDQRRDFTYINDIVRGTYLALKPVGYQIINLGCGSPHTINELIGVIETLLDKKLKIEKKQSSIGDMFETMASIEKAQNVLQWKPEVSLKQGIKNTIEWAYSNIELMKQLAI